jgi:hypothetical protein
MNIDIHYITKAAARVSGHYIGAKEEWWSATISIATREGKHELGLYFKTREAAESFAPDSVREQLAKNSTPEEVQA